MKLSNQQRDKRVLTIVLIGFVLMAILFAVSGDRRFLTSLLVVIGIVVTQRFSFKYFVGAKRNIFILVGSLIILLLGLYS